MAVSMAAGAALEAPARAAAASRIRRQRGYSWEDTIVKRFNAAGWRAFRLGSPSAGLPDVLAVSGREGRLYAIEAKSGTSMSLPVPADQIARCQRWAETFDAYGTRRAVLAFKFLSKKRVGAGRYEGRQLREFFKEWDPRLGAADCVCTYGGQTYVRGEGGNEPVGLRDCAVPFAVRPAGRARAGAGG